MAKQTGHPQRVFRRRVGLPHSAVQMGPHDLAHALLLLHQTLCRVHAHQAKLVDDPLILTADQSLKEPE